MWEEDPHWQQAHYRLVLWFVGATGVTAIGLSAMTGDWDYVRNYFVGLALLALIFFLFGVTVWLLVSVGKILLRVFRRVGGKSGRV